MTAGLATNPVGKASKRRTYRSRWGWWSATAIVLLPALIPPIALTWQVISDGAVSAVPFDRLVELMIGTLALTAAVTLTSLVIGVTTAWLTTRTNLKGRRVWSALAALPLVIPSYMAALTIIGATGHGGVLSEMFGIEVPTPYGFTGAWLALSVFLAPMTHLIVTPALRGIDPATEEAALGLGASQIRAFFTVTLPQLRPALVSAGLMVGLYTISDFGAVSLLRFDTFTRAIFTLYAGQIDRRPAATLSVVLMVLALLILIVERRSRSRAGYGASTSKRKRQDVELKGPSRITGYVFLSGYAAFALAIPATVLLFWLFRGLAAGSEVVGIWPEIGRSLGVSAAAGVLAVVASFPLAMVTTWRKNRASGVVDTSVWGIYSLPHIAVGVAFVAFALRFARPLYQTLALLLIAYVGMFMAQSVGPLQDSLRRASPALEDASRGLGRSWLQTLTRVTVPISSPGIWAGAALVFLSVMKELPATLLLRPNGFETLAIRVWSSTGEGFYTRASVAGLALIAVSIVPLLLMTRRDLSI